MDNSKECIEFMRHRTRQKHGLKWAEVDLQLRGALLEFGSFDVIIDKSTLDAVVCVGDRAACGMVWNVTQALKPDGVYMVVSCHHGQRVQRFLTSPLLALSVKPTEIVVPSCFNGNAFECVKTEATSRCRFEDYVNGVLTNRREEAPKIAESIRRRVKEGFEAHVNGSSMVWDGEVSGERVGEVEVEVEKAYDFMFSAEEKKEYCMEDFHGDLRCFHGGVHVPLLTQQQALAFLEAMQ